MKNQKIESLLDVVNNARTLLDAAFIFHKTYEKCLDAKLTYGDMSVVVNTLFEKEDVTLFDDAIRIDSLLSGDMTIMNINDDTIMSLTAINNVCCDILKHNEKGYIYEKCPDGTFGYKNLLNVTSKFVEIVHRQKEQLDQVHDENERLRSQVNELLQRLDDMQQKATVKNSGKKSKKKLEEEAEVIVDQQVTMKKIIDDLFKIDPSAKPEVPTTTVNKDDVQDTQEELPMDPIINDEEDVVTPDEQTNIDLRKHIIGALDATKRNVQNAYNKLKNDGVEVSMYQIFNVKYGTNPKDVDKEDVYAVIRYARGLEVSDITETIKSECNYKILPRDIVRATRKAK